ncbi:MAG: carbamoyl phosphate synthase small subunit [Candidatus Margulisbacteria bacterium]|nr:carbamoyl phosphate synthase small subunit [Candidatus Margulisiibacteriota bacterium]
MTRAILLLEDGTQFEGSSFGAEGEKIGEVIFNTQIIGWQEMLTDPSYSQKIINIGYPHVGNYGINDRLNESDSTHALALIVKEYSKIYSNWQAKGSLADFMKKNGVIGIEGIDTRALTIHIRNHGEMRGIVSTKTYDVKALADKVKGYKFENRNTKFETNTKSQNIKSKTVVINIGINNSLLTKFPGATIVSDDTTAEKILASGAEEVVISSGPGDPRELKSLVKEVGKLVGKVKLYGIQNGACVLALALGGSVYKMKVGHHGMNIPVVDPKTGSGEISMQNHSYGIEGLGTKGLGTGMEIVHVNLNDKTIEAFKTKDGKCIGTLYFPIDERSKLPKGYKLV